MVIHRHEIEFGLSSDFDTHCIEILGLLFKSVKDMCLGCNCRERENLDLISLN